MPSTFSLQSVTIERMHRFYCHSSLITAAHAVLDGPEAVHAFRVLRLRPGDEIGLVDETGREHCGMVESTRGTKGSIRIDTSRLPQPERVHLALAAALPKATVFDTIVDRATQLGVSVIIPMVTERTIVRLNPERYAAKHQRWQKKAIEAVKQCDRASLPGVLPVQTFAEVLAQSTGYERCFIASLAPDALALKQALSGPGPQSALVLVGPEGDFSPKEYQQAQARGLTSVSLGPRVLRCEVAVTALLGVLCYEWNC